LNNVAIDKPKYDVALSFLSTDEPTAAALHDSLSEGLEVFFFPRKQEELAGTDGLESMRTPFLEGSRVVVVLYREPWGKTPWTGVEETAIKESCFKYGWDRLLFVVLDKASPLPVWLPLTHVRFNFAEFGLEQAAGAIKARVLERGGIVEPLTPLRRADILAQEASYIQDKRQLFQGSGIEIVHQKLFEVFSEIERLCGDINAKGIVSIRVGSTANPRIQLNQCVLTNDRVSLVAVWVQTILNYIDDCAFVVREFNRKMPLPGQRLMFLSEPRTLRETRFLPELSRAREYGWTEEGTPSRFLSSVALAEKCVIQFLDLVARDNRGEIRHPSS
jgi:hypothetical protein